MKKIYVLLTKTGTVPSKIIGKLSRARFSHASLSIDNEFTDMFSFGRKGMKVFPGGFAKENLRTRVLKKYEKPVKSMVDRCRNTRLMKPE